MSVNRTGLSVIVTVRVWVTSTCLERLGTSEPMDNGISLSEPTIMVPVLGVVLLAVAAAA